MTVILFHISVRLGFIVSPDYSVLPSFNWFFNDFLSTCCRCGVDIFLMLSGALSLGRVWDIKTFLGKRIPRIVLPFLFWGFVLTLSLAVISFIFPNIVDEFAKYSFLFFDTTSIKSFLEFLGTSYLGKNKWFGPYWFFWMILGTYLIMPIFNRWVYAASMKEIEYFLVIWFVTCIFGSTLYIDFPIKLRYFVGPIGMVILGYYLRHSERKIYDKLWFSCLLILVGGISAIAYSYFNSDSSNIYLLSRYSVFLVIEVMGIFLLFKNIDKKNIDFFNSSDSIFRKVSFSIAKYSYGIYLVHQVIMNLLIILLIPYCNYKVLALLLFIGTLTISWLILAVLNRIPYINQVIGAK